MIGVITGDIINSRSMDPKAWLEITKEILGRFGSTPGDWDIYRGDAFQLSIDEPLNTLKAAITIKAAIKQLPKLDLRMSIGIGEKSFDAERVSQSGGSAFVFSGEGLEKQKKDKINLVIKTSWPEFDKEMNLYLRLGLIAMDNWTPVSAQTINAALKFEEFSQEQLGQLQEIKQSTVSRRLRRAYFDEILELEAMFRYKLSPHL